MFVLAAVLQLPFLVTSIFVTVNSLRRTGDWPEGWPYTLLDLVFFGLLAFWAFQFFRSRRQDRRDAERLAGPKGVLWGEQIVRASRLGVGVRRARQWSAYRWSAFERVERKRDRINLRVSNDFAVSVPHAGFSGPAEIEAFFGFAEARLRGGPQPSV